MPHTILVVDDDTDIYAVTRLSLKDLRFQGERLKIEHASSGEEAVEFLRKNPDVPVILMDVVMERDDAGLQAVRRIRQDLGNRYVRILLRTGQPGMAPEREVIDNYDIDDYLTKSEVTSNRLYTSVRTALKGYFELRELQLHRDALDSLNSSTLDLHGAENQDEALNHLLEITAQLVESPLTLLYFAPADGEEPIVYAKGPADRPTAEVQRDSEQVLQEAQGHQSELTDGEGLMLETGMLVPFLLSDNRGVGFLFVAVKDPDPMVTQILNVLSAHASLVLYRSAPGEPLDNSNELAALSPEERAIDELLMGD